MPNENNPLPSYRLRLRARQIEKLASRVAHSEGRALADQLRLLTRYRRQMLVTGAIAGLLTPAISQDCEPALTLRVDNIMMGQKLAPSVASDKLGNFVVAWVDDNQTELRFQRFDLNGQELGNEIIAKTGYYQDSPDIAMDDDGNFALTWSGYNGASSVFVQKYAADGSPIGTETEFGGIPNHFAPRIAMDSDGDFVVSWIRITGFERDIVAQRFDAMGVTQGALIEIDVDAEERVDQPDVAMDDDGDFVVTWERGDYDLYARLYNSAGQSMSPAFLVSSSIVGYAFNMHALPAVAADHDGNFVVSWRALDGVSDWILARRFDHEGNALDLPFRVSDGPTTDIENQPVIAMDPEGDFTIAWEQVNAQDDIYLRRFSADGQPRDSRILVTSGTNNDPAIATDADGDIVVVWNGGNSQGIQAGQITCPFLPLHCTDSGEEQLVNTYFTNNQTWPDMAMDAEGNFVICWSSDGQDLSDEGIYGQRFAADGSTLGNEFLVNTQTNGIQILPAAAMDLDGNYVIVWQSQGQDGSGYGIYAQRFFANGTKNGSEQRINQATTGSQSSPAVSMDAQGNYTVAWQSSLGGSSGTEIMARQFNADGSPVDDEFTVNTFSTGAQTVPDIAVNHSGDFVVVWQSFGQDGDGTGIFGLKFSNAGAPIGPEFAVNQEVSSFQQVPMVEIDVEGDFVVAWQSSLQDGDNDGIFARQFAADSAPIDDEFRVNCYTKSFQRTPSIAMDTNGDFIIAWFSDGQDGSSNAIRAQRFAANGDLIDTEMEVNTYTDDSQTFPVVAMDSDGEYAMAWVSVGPYGADQDVYVRTFNCCPPAYSQATGNRLAGVLNFDAQWEAAELIESIQLLDGGGVQYDAGQTIDLLPGFEVTLGTVFETLLDGCDQ